jgi:kinesin family member 11
MLTIFKSINTKNSAIQASTKAVHEETVKIVDAQLGQMATQMSALDGFVTRARAQNDNILEEHIGGLLQISLHVAQMQMEISQNMEQREVELQAYQQEATSTNEELRSATDSASSAILSSVKTAQEAIHGDTLQDYVPTGETPQKREWSYPTRLPSTANHQSIIAARRGLPDPTVEAKTPSTSRTPGRSPKKQPSPRKGSPSKSSPSKTKVFSDEKTQTMTKPLKASHESLTEPLKGLKEINVNVVPRPASAAGDHLVHPFSKSVGSGQPPLKRHATATGEMRLNSTKARTPKTRTPGVENLSQSIGPGGGRRLRSSPQES